MDDRETIRNLEEQLASLYAERETLDREIGASSAPEILSMVSSLEGQLRDFYDRFGDDPGLDDPDTALMVRHIRDLSGRLDPMYAKRTVELFMDSGKPVLRAAWSESGAVDRDGSGG